MLPRNAESEALKGKLRSRYMGFAEIIAGKETSEDGWPTDRYYDLLGAVFETIVFDKHPEISSMFERCENKEGRVTKENAKGIHCKLLELQPLAGTRILEVGGDWMAFLHQYGAEVTCICPESWDFEEWTFKDGIPTRVHVIRENLEPGNVDRLIGNMPAFDVTCSKQVLDDGSGLSSLALWHWYRKEVWGIDVGPPYDKRKIMAYGFFFERLASVTNLLGYSIHNGGSIPRDETYLAGLGLSKVNRLWLEDYQYSLGVYKKYA